MILKNFSRLFLMSTIMVTLMIMSGCDDVNQTTKQVKDNITEKVESEMTKENPFVLSVKNGHLSEYPNIKIDDVFSNFFSSPTWKYFKSDKGINVVEFTGYCTYVEQKVKAKVQFIVDENSNNFQIEAVAFNNIPQNKLTKAALIRVIYENNKNNETSDIEQGSPNYVEWNKITSSSKLSQGEIAYKASNVDDWDNSTAWVEGNNEDGIGEWIKLEKSNPITISGIEIMNGYHKSEKLYTSNNRVKKVLIEFSDGTSISKELVDRFEYNNQIPFDKKITTKYIKITIIEVYKGSKYRDTCISEIHAY